LNLGLIDMLYSSQAKKDQ